MRHHGKRPKPQPRAGPPAAHESRHLGRRAPPHGGVPLRRLENAGVPYDDRAIAVVDFSSLDSKAKKNVLQAANRARCACTCGLQLAQCVATDSTCPIRNENIERIKTMVRQAMPRT